MIFEEYYKRDLGFLQRELRDPDLVKERALPAMVELIQKLLQTGSAPVWFRGLPFKGDLYGIDENGLYVEGYSRHIYSPSFKGYPLKRKDFAEMLYLRILNYLQEKALASLFED